jgi:hypothetical protein
METILSIFDIPSQCSTSGINAWNRISLTPAISSVDLKYLSAESPPRLRRLYTRYLCCRVSYFSVNSWTNVLGYFTESTSFFPEVDNDADAATLRTADAFLDSESEVGFACADVGSENVRAVAWKRGGEKWTVGIMTNAHSSWTRRVSSFVASDMYAGFPTTKYT